MDRGGCQLRGPLFAALLLTLAVSPAFAQKPPASTPPPRSPTLPKPAPQKPKVPKQYRGFIAIGGGVQAAGSALSDTFTFETNAETGSASVDYGTKPGPMFDVAVGWRFWKSGGFAVGLSRTSSSDSAEVAAEIPHPFFDDSDRHVEGEADDIGRTEIGAHVQVFWLREHRKWRTRVLGGLTYFNVEQDVVTSVTVIETYPYDVAEFEGVKTARGSGSGLGFNAGIDVAWMQTPQFGWGVAVRYTRGKVDLNVSEGRNVSTDAGGAQAVAGVRIAF